ncbi:hypothetical protein V4C53_10465 [Paraburkholderia azotifigens]|uniref:hypothetical protein n=1 Tax=Paraburkholderia azotifigens TaxID=2057004 RepID=UPI003179A6B2
MHRAKILLAVVAPIAIAGAVATCNYFSLSRPLASVLERDPRNAGISASAHYEYYVIPSSIVFDLRSVSSTNSPLDVTRVLLQFSAAMKDHEYEDVILEHDGTAKFRLDGKYFHELGDEFGVQNPVYTIRTMPEHIRRLDGSAAFGSWTGGWLGVFGKQMDDVNEFHKQWYISDIAKASS